MTIFLAVLRHIINQPDNQGMPDCEPIRGKTYRADGWRYRDISLPHEAAPEFQAIKIALDTNIVWLTWRSLRNTFGGQALISPEGFNILKKLLQEKQN